jgi:hypothetical protein
MLGLAETQLPTPDDIAAHNQEVDATNEADAAMQKTMPKEKGMDSNNPNSAPGASPTSTPPASK